VARGLHGDGVAAEDVAGLDDSLEAVDGGEGDGLAGIAEGLGLRFDQEQAGAPGLVGSLA
jgi:hypothetical protein